MSGQVSGSTLILLISNRSNWTGYCRFARLNIILTAIQTRVFEINNCLWRLWYGRKIWIYICKIQYESSSQKLLILFNMNYAALRNDKSQPFYILPSHFQFTSDINLNFARKKNAVSQNSLRNIIYVSLWKKILSRIYYVFLWVRTLRRFMSRYFYYEFNCNHFGDRKRWKIQKLLTFVVTWKRDWKMHPIRKNTNGTVRMIPAWYLVSITLLLCEWVDIWTRVFHCKIKSPSFPMFRVLPKLGLFCKRTVAVGIFRLFHFTYKMGVSKE